VVKCVELMVILDRRPTATVARERKGSQLFEGANFKFNFKTGFPMKSSLILAIALLVPSFAGLLITRPS
jgi:hypothetical protein